MNYFHFQKMRSQEKFCSQEEILLLLSLYLSLHLVHLILKHFHEMVRDGMRAAHRGVHRVSLVGGNSGWLWFMVAEALPPETESGGLILYCLCEGQTCSDLWERITWFSKFSNTLKVLLPHEAPVNVPFPERTGALPTHLATTPVHGKITVAQVNKHRHLFPAWCLTFH